MFQNHKYMKDTKKMIIRECDAWLKSIKEGVFNTRDNCKKLKKTKSLVS